MDFNPNKPIYQQIAEYCYSKIMADEWEVDCRIPSVKELAMTMAVNPRTVIKAYDDMQAIGVIYQKRGLGYFVAPEAHASILAERRTYFFSTTMPEIMKETAMLSITPEELYEWMKENDAP